VAKSTDGGETFTQQKVADIRQIPSRSHPAAPMQTTGTTRSVPARFRRSASLTTAPCTSPGANGPEPTPR
jgi:hypothetical protein